MKLIDLSSPFEREYSVPSYLLQGLKLQIYRLRRWVPLIPLQKLPVRFSPGGLEKKPHILGIFFLGILLPFRIFNLPGEERQLRERDEAEEGAEARGSGSDLCGYVGQPDDGDNATEDGAFL